ncbi:tryptophan-rich sensory protein, partial [Chloroflexota bacterium]
VFWVQLVPNIIWSIVFFGIRSLFGGMSLILILWIAILVNMIVFFGVSPVADELCVPYIIKWVSIATNLNIQVWKLNR